ncbi:UbiH/UbiF family hydroxylase [Noviherbaspirillum sp. CPCC 100848]|uniref:UbiH/UbiF family hydroxylase n=1 Tax=Noviherbaspirillum album TaxID=3080276 RepID=A0ABU6JCU6_9BURK|nr:UbiH/UbiF family hydroxylase [Noviherbaspirillum sp. CPCC 100848]MEC4721471.1 UbiH/UbiF family hydroxylase [Noviherbaspirillum sp. CPCC 100848]
MQIQSDVCVIGNGAVGKAAALGFAQAGLSVSLLAPPEPAGVGAGAAEDGWDVRVYALNHVANELLASLKVWSAMDASRIAAVDAMIVKGDGAQAGQLDFDAFGARTGALAWIVEDSNLNKALDAAMKFAPDTRIVTGRASRLQLNLDVARVELDNGDVLAASLVVGADGAQSWVRGQCDIGLDYRSYGQQAVVANFECERPHQGAAYQWFTSDQGIVALLPLPGNRTSLVWSAPEALAQSLVAGSASELAERVGAVSGHALGALRPVQPEVVKAFPLRLMRPHAITAPRVALVGDAAHVVHPLAGHGMNLGFADVVGLLKAVSQRESHRDCGDERVLGRYARSRKEDILLMLAATDGLERLFSSTLEPVRMVRNIGLNLVNKLPVLKRALISHAMGKRTQ